MPSPRSLRRLANTCSSSSEDVDMVLPCFEAVACVVAGVVWAPGAWSGAAVLGAGGEVVAVSAVTKSCSEVSL